MKKTPLVVSAMVSVSMVYWGSSIHGQAKALLEQSTKLSRENNEMTMAISAENLLAQKPPVELGAALSFLVNEMRFLEGYSGTSMSLTIAKAKDSDEIADYFMESQYRGIKKLPVTIQVNKFSSQTDMAAALSDIYQLEFDTDFKVTGINKENDSLIVKGDVYGI